MSDPSVCPKCVLEALLARLEPDDPDARARMAVHLLAFCSDALRVLLHKDFALCSKHVPTPEQAIDELAVVMDALRRASKREG